MGYLHEAENELVLLEYSGKIKEWFVRILNQYGILNIICRLGSSWP